MDEDFDPGCEPGKLCHEPSLVDWENEGMESSHMHATCRYILKHLSNLVNLH